MNVRKGMRWPRVCGVPVLVAAMCAAAQVAPAQETDPYQEEWSDVFEGDRNRPSGDVEAMPGQSAPHESGTQEPPEELGRDQPEEEQRHKTGAEARRELLFRDGLNDRNLRYPDGLRPLSPVARSGQDVYNARFRGRDAQVLRETPQGLSAGGGVNAGMFVDSNPQLLSDDAALGRDPGAWGWFVEPTVAVARRTPRTLFQGVVRLPYNQFNSFEDDVNDDLTSFDQYAGLQYDLYGRENAFNLFTNVSNATRRTAIVQETGENLNGRRVLTFGGGGSYKRTLTPDSVVQLSASAFRQNLAGTDNNDIIEIPGETGPIQQLEDSTYYQFALDFRKLVTRTDAAGVGASYSKFLPEGILNPDVRIITALANWSRDVSSSMNFLIEAGAQIVTAEEQNALTPSETTIVPYFQTSLYWGATLRDNFLFTYSHSVVPTAAGEVRTNNLLEIQYQRVLTRRLSLGVPVLVIFQNQSLDDFTSRTYVQFGPNLVWLFHRAWGLSLEYQFRLNNEQDSPGVTSNAAFLSLNYYGQWYP